MEDETVNLLDNDRVHLLGFEKPELNGSTEQLEINGVDGILPSVTTYGPYELTLNFRYVGVDPIDVDIFCFNLEQKIQKETPYYLSFSEMPGLKYAVLPSPKVSPSPFAIRYVDFEITFTVYKGYAESLMSTDNLELNSDFWQFGNNIVTNEDLQYTHHKTKFDIYNASPITVTPINRHNLIITMNIQAPNGFKLKNKKTGDVFEYKKALKKSDTLVLNGVYPYKNKKRCGKDTNWEFITLASGYNAFEVIGDGVEVEEIGFSFNFVYR